MSRLIHKYTNRRLYDTHRGRTITLLELADVVLGGEDVHVQQRSTREDITTVTLLHALVERLKHHPDDAKAGLIADRLVAALVESRDVADDPSDMDDVRVGIA